MPTSAIRINRGDVYGDRVCRSRQILEFYVKQFILIYPECVVAYAERTKVKISLVIRLSYLDK